MTITNRRDQLVHVTRVVEDLAAKHHLARDVVVDVHVVLDEVLTNIITYAYEDDREHDISIGFTIGDDAIEAEIVDDGRPFDPTTIPPPDPSASSASLGDRRVGGLGMHFVRHLMSEVAYSRSAGRNHLHLKRRWR